MTMTDTEAKALALVNEHPGCEIRKTRPGGSMLVPFKVLCRAIEREAATEARHATELREQAERFSDAVERVLTVTDRRQETHAWRTLSPFILPAPDPLVEALNDMKDGRAGPTTESYASCLRAAMQARGYEWRKIGEAGE